MSNIEHDADLDVLYSFLFAVAVIVAFAFLLPGCTMPGRVKSEYRDKTFACTDSRDGEVFYFNMNDVTDVQTGWGAEYTYSCHVTDTDGTPRVITSRSEAWLKCVEKEDER